MKVVFFDRDGIVNQRIMCGYVTNPEEFVFQNDFLDFFPTVFEHGYEAILVTNQQGIAKGIMTHYELHTVHQYMQDQLFHRTGRKFLDVYAATEFKSSAIKRRKPSAAMLQEAATLHSIDLSKSIMIGDTPTDVEAGVNAGAFATILVDRGDGVSSPLASMTVKKLSPSIWNNVRQ
jgi:histidinol-phosphate phosphatase family protein